MRVFRFAAAGLLAAAAIVGGAAAVPDNNQWPLVAQPDNRGRYSSPGDAKGEF